MSEWTQPWEAHYISLLTRLACGCKPSFSLVLESFPKDSTSPSLYWLFSAVLFSSFYALVFVSDSSWPTLTQSLACAYPIINPTGELNGKCNLRSLPGDLPDRAEILPGSGERPLSICLLLLLFLICCCFPICGLKSGSQYVLGRKTTSLLKPGTVRFWAAVFYLDLQLQL